jgi:hypothetical protein
MEVLLGLVGEMCDINVDMHSIFSHSRRRMLFKLTPEVMR